MREAFGSLYPPILLEASSYNLLQFLQFLKRNNRNMPTVFCLCSLYFLNLTFKFHT